MTMLVRCVLLVMLAFMCQGKLWNHIDQNKIEYGGLKRLSLNTVEDLGPAFDSIDLDVNEDVNKNIINKWLNKMSSHSSLFHRSKRSAREPNATYFSLRGTEHNNEAYVHWSGKQNSEVIIVLTRQESFITGQIVSSSVWSSKNYGLSYQKEKFPNNSIITYFYVSPVIYKNAIFVDYYNKTLYITTDELETTSTVELDFEVDKLVLHPSRDSWALAYSLLARELRYSKDFGKTWTLLHKGVSPKFYWYIPDVDPDDSTVHLEIISSNGDSAHYKKCTLEKCSSTDTIDRKLGSFEPISLLIIKQYIFVEKLTEEKSEMYVSYKRQDFKKAYFPPNTLPKNFLIMNADEDQVFVGVTNTDGVTLYLSDTTGQFYVPSLTNLLYIKRGFPIIDFHEVKALKGIYLANQKSITNDKIEVKTLISFDKGGLWKVIPTPADEISKCSSGTDCSLHLHLDLGSIVAPGILSESKAPGLVLAHGNVGDKLDGTSTNVYVSRNGGVTWKNTGLIGMYRFNILDQGSVLTAIKEATHGVTNVIYYSYDQGNSWKSFNFSEKMVQVDGALNEPEINSLSLSIYGHRPTSETTAWVLITINFKTLLTNKCKKEDYEIWMPGDNTQKNCTLGQTLRFERRKQSSMCYIGVDYKPLLNHTTCLCEIEDYECDFGYENIDNKCKPSSWFDPDLPPVECQEGQQYNKSLGYRKVASDKCKGNSHLADVFNPVLKNCTVVAPRGLSLHTDTNVIATNTPITIELTQAGGSRNSTKYTWDFGDKKTKTVTGLENSVQIKHIYKKYGIYNISVTASNSKGNLKAHLLIRVEEKVTLLMLDTPKFTQSKKSTMVEVLAAYSYLPTNKEINHTLFVWTWGDESGSYPELSWLKVIHHTYNKSGLYHGSVETLNSVSSIYKQFTVQVFDKTSSVRLGFSSRIHRYNLNVNQDSRVLMFSLLKREIMNALGIEDSRLDVHQNKQEPFSVDVIFVPGDQGEVKHEDLAKKLVEVVNKNELHVGLDGSTNSLYQISVISATLLQDIDATTTNTNHSPNLRPVYIAVPVLIVIVVLTALVFLYYRRSYRQARRYNMLRSHNDEDNAMLGEDDDDDEPPLDLNPDFARDRNYHDDQLDLGSGSHLVMVTGGRNSDEE